MKLDVLKFPNGAETLPIAQCVEVDGDAPLPQSPWERMTLDEFEEWKADNQITTPDPAETDEEKVERIVSGGDAIYSAQTLENQATFAPFYMTAKYFSIRGKFDVAGAIVANTEVPPELEDVKTQFIELLTPNVMSIHPNIGETSAAIPIHKRLMSFCRNILKSNSQ